MKPQKIRWHHGPTLGTVILIVIAIGATSAAVLEYRNLAPAVKYAQNASNRIDELSKQNSDLSQQLADLRTVNQLAAKTPPAEVVLKEYSSSNLSLLYPEDFTFVKAAGSFPALTIKKDDQSRVEIFRARDFPGGKRTLPAGVVASKIGSLDNDKVAPYDVWIYYGAADETVKAELDKIAASIKVIK
jgi:hypothetical protein